MKPENLLLSDQGDKSCLKIADFGLSAVVFAAAEMHENTTPQNLNNFNNFNFNSQFQNNNNNNNNNNSVSPLMNKNTNHQENQLNFISNSSSSSSSNSSPISSPTVASPSKHKSINSRTSNVIQFNTPSSNNNNNNNNINNNKAYQHENQPHNNRNNQQHDQQQQQQQQSYDSTQFLSTPVFRRLKSVVGSPHYAAPEINQGGTLTLHTYKTHTPYTMHASSSYFINQTLHIFIIFFFSLSFFLPQIP